MKCYAWILLMGVLLAACNRRQSIPDITLLMPDSTTYFNIASLPKGKPVLLMYYQPYCEACRAEWEGIMTNIENFRDVQFCLITDQPYHDMMAFYKNYAVKQFSNVVMGRDTGYVFSERYKPRGVPYNVFFDKKGRYRGGGMMVLDVHQLDSLLAKL